MFAAIAENLDWIIFAIFPIFLLSVLTWTYGQGLDSYHPKKGNVWAGAFVHAFSYVLPLSIAMFTLFFATVVPENQKNSLYIVGIVVGLTSALLPLLLTMEMQFHFPIIGRWLLAYRLASIRRNIEQSNIALPELEQLEWDLYGPQQ